jgi:hypothetical protein
MELSQDEICRHLPEYLSPDDKTKLFDELKSFPENIDGRIYTSHPKLSNEIIYQGDIISSQPVVFLPDDTIKMKQVFVISNTCDIDLSNKRIKTPRVVYCPIILFQAYSQLIHDYYDTYEAAQDHLNTIKKQRITSMFYLPEYGDVKESIVLFDATNNHRLDAPQLEDMLDKRVVSLANYGFYLFLVKLSIHFTRIEERVNRG